MQVFLDMVGRSRLLAPNLKEMTLTLYTGRTHKGNEVARAVVRDHLAALRWMNPNAVIYLREASGQGTPTVSYSLCASRPAARPPSAHPLSSPATRALTTPPTLHAHTHAHTRLCARRGAARRRSAAQGDGDHPQRDARGGGGEDHDGLA